VFYRHLGCVTRLSDQSFDDPKLIELAISIPPNKDIMNKLKGFEYHNSNPLCGWSAHPCVACTTQNNIIDLVKYLADHDAPVSKHFLIAREQIESFKYIFDLRWSKSLEPNVVVSMVDRGLTDLLRYTRSAWEADESVRRLDLVEIAVAQGHFKCFEYLLELGFPYDINTIITHLSHGDGTDRCTAKLLIMRSQ
jgi:hypothetical protein